MEREVRYSTAEDGVRIAYCVEGKGPGLLALPFFIESFSLDHLFPQHRKFLQEISAGRTLIRFDPRGVGLSERDITDISPAALIADGLAVMQACTPGQPYAVWAYASTGAFAVRAALERPHLIDKLILYGTCASLADAFPPAMLATFAGLAEVSWPLACRTFADLTGRIGFPEEALHLAEWYERSTTGSVGAEYIRQNIELNIKDRLREVTQPTLVLHRINDPTIRFELGQEMAREIPNARFVPLPGGGSNMPSLSESQPIVDAVQAFLNEGSVASRPVPEEHSGPATVRTVLFTDLVGHTEMMSGLGDAKGRDILREHERITRKVLKANGGTEVKTMGDGFMASFGSVTKAVECAVALQRAFAEREGEPLSVRVGLNAGEPIEEDGDLFGATVILASRIAAKAEGGEILVADTVRGLCSGKGFLFADRGEFVAKGFEEPVRVYEVSWRS